MVRFRLFWWLRCPRIWNTALVLVVLLASSLSAPAAPQSNTPEEVLAWYRKQTVPAYFKSGNANPKWDHHATNALELFAQRKALPSQYTPENWQALSLSLSNAVHAGCKDPLIEWLTVYYRTSVQETDTTEFIRSLMRTAGRLQKSKYTTAFKYEAQMDPYATWIDQGQRGRFPALQKEVDACYSTAFGLAAKITKETNTPIEVIYPCLERLEYINSKFPSGLTNLYFTVNSNLNKHWPNSAHTALFRGLYFYDYAMLARGIEYVDKVSPENLQLAGERFLKAREWLLKAWEINPTIGRLPSDMIRVEQNFIPYSRASLETWFQRGMAMNTNDIALCGQKLNYLLPQWGGSHEQMIDFGRECVASTKWGGAVPRTLVSAHEYIVTYMPASLERTNYWKSPVVWKDLQSAFEKNLRTEPRNTNSNRQMFIFYARRSGQWSVIREQLPLLTYTNINYFGGRAAFDRMVENAAKAP